MNKFSPNRGIVFLQREKYFFTTLRHNSSRWVKLLFFSQAVFFPPWILSECVHYKLFLRKKKASHTSDKNSATTKNGVNKKNKFPKIE